MQNVWSSEIDKILSVGLSLEAAGVRNWALDRDAAIAALDQLVILGVGVLGGDVYAVTENTLEANYDSWYFNRASADNDADFVPKSIDKARRYISGYPAGENVRFAIVPGT